MQTLVAAGAHYAQREGRSPRVLSRANCDRIKESAGAVSQRARGTEDEGEDPYPHEFGADSTRDAGDRHPRAVGGLGRARGDRTAAGATGGERRAAG